MRGRVVIGANFGDEGKGLMVDYLCAYEGAGAVVRFNGGAQSGHTVITPDGRRHVFHHFGAGAFSGVPTYLSQYFALNPILFFRELDELSRLGLNPVVFAHPSCLVTTFADMMINQRRENERGDKRHGSVGIGFHETLTRSKVGELKITMSDLWNGVRLESRLAEICDRWAKYRCGTKLDEPAMAERFLKGCAIFAEAVHPAGIQQCKDPVFEGGQGLLLDQHNKEFFPHVTHSSTGMKNVRELAAQAKLTDLDVYYMSRTYLTRHGAGPLPGENPGMKFEDDTNVDHPYQGTLRFAPLDGGALHKRIRTDAESSPYKLVLTHCDQLESSVEADLCSYGSTREDVRTVDKRKRITA